MSGKTRLERSQGLVSKLDFCPRGFSVFKCGEAESSYNTSVSNEIFSVLVRVVIFAIPLLLL